jgi:hypothetical protein
MTGHGANVLTQRRARARDVRRCCRGRRVLSGPHLPNAVLLDAVTVQKRLELTRHLERS